MPRAPDIPATGSRTTTDPARQAALRLLDLVLGEGRLLSDNAAAQLLAALEPADRARAQRLAAETLRGLERADRLLDRHLRKRPALTGRNILRMATVELAQGGDAHGVVGAAVDLAAAEPRLARLKGLINAVLRKLAAEAPARWSDLRIPRLPRWLRTRLIETYGAGAVAAMERAHFRGAPLDLTARDDAAGLAAQTCGQVLPTGSVRLPAGVQVSNLPGFAAGAFWVQDAAAALPARVLAPRRGERVLDLCAAPGGKTLQLAAAGADVTALDLSQSRMARLHENLRRTGLTASCVTGDALSFAAPPFDAVLLDAPCSATGTIRRHPDLPHARDGTGLAGLIDLQARLIDHALTLLKPGGRLVVCTCSLLPEEGEHQAQAALARHPELRTDAEALRLPGVDPDWIGHDGGLRLRPDCWPEMGGMDGFHIVCMRT
mgnify:CR=1 FL=1